MDANATADRLAFEVVFLDPPADVAALSRATETLHATTAAEFTAAAAATLEDRGIEPRPQRVSGRRGGAHSE